MMCETRRWDSIDSSETGTGTIHTYIPLENGQQKQLNCNRHEKLKAHPAKSQLQLCALPVASFCVIPTQQACVESADCL